MAGQYEKRKTSKPEYNAWAGMVQRCRDKNAINYGRYGGKGVRVCDEWLPPGGFDRFITHIGPRPTAKHQIDRIEGTRGYEPGNVRWATVEEQAKNRSSTIMVTIGSETMCVSDWCKRTGVEPFTAYARITYGWDPARAVSEAVTDGRHVFFGELLTTGEAAKKYGMTVGALANRLYRGWPPDDAVSAPRGMKYPVWLRKKAKAA
jgi:hypothetical protein